MHFGAYLSDQQQHQHRTFEYYMKMNVSSGKNGQNKKQQNIYIVHKKSRPNAMCVYVCVQEIRIIRSPCIRMIFAAAFCGLFVDSLASNFDCASDEF